MKLKHLQMNQTLNQFNRLSPAIDDTKRPLSQQNLLFWVAAEDQPPTPSALADAMGLTKAAITKMLNPLIDDGLLTKTMDVRDNRSFTLSLTPAGEAEVAALSPTYFEPMNRLREGMGQTQFDQLIELLETANEVLMD
ncbi:MarR family winged helix-turn-helix transcriptional regulator [Lacticaseibacillus parakribbianus]|uniref:MarR family winged helix-turn-helix transcriptional regulator n=1 Tax=Lacticaseibacillus parakribbianus TaxID=2970927 RepID=UPI0021CB12A7|nr:MarR family winged helix-turn-helix transcriptional regulator [Lacticaseibacillus parakribbianus]